MRWTPMATNAQANRITNAYNGRGWENSVKISSVEELRSNLIDLGASISFNDSFGVTNANVNVDGKFITTESTIDSYRSYLALGQLDEARFSNFNGNYNSNTAYYYGGSPLNFNLFSADETLNSLRFFAEKLDPGQRGYLAFDIRSSDIELDNGLRLNSSSNT